MPFRLLADLVRRVDDLLSRKRASAAAGRKGDPLDEEQLGGIIDEIRALRATLLLCHGVAGINTPAIREVALRGLVPPAGEPETETPA